MLESLGKLFIQNFVRTALILKNNEAIFNLDKYIFKQFRSSFCAMANVDEVQYLDIPTKSENDKKIYKTLLLKNGLRALLVSDPSPVPEGLTSSSDDSCGEESSSDSDRDSSITSTSSDDDDDSDDDDSEEGNEKLAACALLVDVGSFSEPEKYQGLAHFLEHMIFMGSHKFPAENAFDAHIKKCGGFDNANTECEETLFYFEVPEEHLDSSMEYFSALLRGPLMKQEAMTRERDSVESEFQQTLHDDEARRDQLLASLASSNFPHRTFTWGNKKTLKENVNDDELHKVLHEFCKRHYSSHRMAVCVQARLPIEELESYVLKHFSDIPNNNLPGDDFTKFKYDKAFQEEFYTNVFFVKPVETVCKLELTWVLPPMQKLYRCKPDHFLAYLLGYEGEGSLCAYLRKRLWALDLISGVDESGFDSNSMYSLFNLCIFLTDTGFQHLDEVLAATFASVKLLTQCGSLEGRYAELQHIEQTSFRFESQRPAFDNVQSLVSRIKYYPPKDILAGAHLYFEYNEEQVMDVIRYLNEFKFNIMITSNQKYNGITYNRKEKWFGTEYTCMKMPQKWKDLWDNSQPMDELFLPTTNRFIPTNFSLFWVDNCKPELPSVPKKILQTDTCQLYFRQDDKFDLPDAYMYFNFISPLLAQSPKYDVMCALYALLVKFSLVEELYPATVAGLNYQLYSYEKGIMLKVSGYNEKMHLVIDIITKAMSSIHNNITKDQLEVYKRHQKKDYFNALIKPRTLNKNVRRSILECIHWPMIDKYKCLNDVTLDDMIGFAKDFTKELYVQALMQGNLTEEIAHNVMNTVLSMLNCQPIRETKYIEYRTTQIPLGTHYARVRAMHEKDTNTIICNYYQIGPCTVRMESILDLLMMFVEEPLMDTLRTKEQLGYSVSSSVRISYGIAGYSITVNSQEYKFDADYVQERIEAFRTKMLTILEKVSQDEFEQVRDSLIKIKQVVDMSLSEEVSRNWGEITCEEYIFDRRRREVDVVKTLTKQDIIDFCLDNEMNNFRKLSVQVIGNKSGGDVKKSKSSTSGSDHAKEGNDNSESSDEMDDDDNDELFNALANKLELEFLTKEGDETYIKSIEEFKQNLYVFPVTKTKFETDPSIVNERVNTPTSEVIGQCSYNNEKI